MKQKLFYSQTTLLLFRLFAIIGIIILSCSNLIRFNTFGYQKLLKNQYELFTFYCNFIFIVLFFIVAIFPTKIGLCSLIAFLDSIIIFLFEPHSNMGIIMYFIAAASFCARGHFRKHKKIRNAIIGIIYLALILTELRFKNEKIAFIFLEKGVYTFGLLVFTFFAKAYITNMFEYEESNHILDIKNYPSLKKRDAKWLVYIINGKKYDAIAIENTPKISTGTVKNRIKFIYNELCVGDKQGFLNAYSDYEIHYGDELITADTIIE